MDNYYQLLNIELGATAEQIKKAYREQVKKWHPDKNADNIFADGMSKLINHAYEVLSDPIKRATYDKQLREYLYVEEMKRARNQRGQIYTGKYPAGQFDFSKMKGEELLLYFLIKLIGRALR